MSLILLSSFASAQSWTVQVDPLTAALGFAHVQVERVLVPNASIYLGPHLRLYDAPWSKEHEPYRGYGAELGLRWYPWREAPHGPWLMGRGVLASLHTTDGSDLRDLGGYGSVLGGGTLILGERWVLSGGAGVNVLRYTVGDYGVHAVLPALHTAVGVAF